MTKAVSLALGLLLILWENGRDGNAIKLFDVMLSFDGSRNKCEAELMNS